MLMQVWPGLTAFYWSPLGAIARTGVRLRPLDELAMEIDMFDGDA